MDESIGDFSPFTEAKEDWTQGDDVTKDTNVNANGATDKDQEIDSEAPKNRMSLICSFVALIFSIPALIGA